MIVVSHPTGNANVRGLLDGLREHDLLFMFYTTLGYSSQVLWYKMLPAFVKRELDRRSYNLPTPIIRSHPWLEIKRLGKERLNLLVKQSARNRTSVDEVYRNLDRYVADHIEKGIFSRQVKAVYGYEDGCLDSFRAARSRGWHRFYELPIGYWRAAKKILETEAELQPEWAVTIPALNEPMEKLERKEEELRLASHILVASAFTLKTLDLVPEKIAKISVIPYGAPTIFTDQPQVAVSGKPLRVLYVGGLTQRKGLSYLFEAVEGLGSAVALTIVGRSGTGHCQVLQKHLARHNWIETMPHKGILECMRCHDVFVFPSLFEGFGLVILEALSQGVPVITTPHTGGPDILDEGRDGFIVPIRSAEAIKEKLELLYNNPELLMEMKQNALDKAKQLTWQGYGKAISLKLVETMRTQKN